jgi:integrase
MKGTTYQRSDGKWVGSVELPRSSDGKRRRKVFYGNKEKDVLSKMNELKYQLQNNIYRDPGNATIKNLIREWLDNHNDIEETTKALYEFYAKKHMKGIEDIKIKSVLSKDIEGYYSLKLKSGLSSNTVIKLHTFLHSAFEYAIKNKLVLMNPVDIVKRPKKIKYKPKIATNKEFEELVVSVVGTFDEIVIIFAGVLGLRRGEIFGLKWSDVDFGKQTITINQTKVRFDKYIVKKPKTESSHRTIHAPGFVFERLNAYKGKITLVDGFICNKYKPDAYSKHFKKLMLLKGLDGIKLHGLRHYNAVLMMMYGISDAVAAARLGHSQVSTLNNIYQHDTEEVDKMAAATIDAALKDKIK